MKRDAQILKFKLIFHFFSFSHHPRNVLFMNRSFCNSEFFLPIYQDQELINSPDEPREIHDLRGQSINLQKTGNGVKQSAQVYII